MSIMATLVLFGGICLIASVAEGPKQQQTHEGSHGSQRSRVKTSSSSLPAALGKGGEGPQSAVAVTESAPGVERCKETAKHSLPKVQRWWCCAAIGLLCPKLDCHAGYDNWERGWSAGKKVWCCKRFSRGCSKARGQARSVTHPTSTQYKFDCSTTPGAAIDKVVESWSDEQREWCCWRVNKGCPVARSSSSAFVYNCLTLERWSPEKTVWCCERQHLGCPTTTTTRGTIT